MALTTYRAKWWLAGLWLAGFLGVLLVLVAQSAMNYYEPRTADAWTWFMTTLMPTVSLIVGVLVADFHAGRVAGPPAQVPVPPALFWLAAGLSGVYLLLVAISILAQPFLSTTPPLELMQRSNLWLAPMQALTLGALGAFFRNA